MSFFFFYSIKRDNRAYFNTCPTFYTFLFIYIRIQETFLVRFHC